MIERPSIGLVTALVALAAFCLACPPQTPRIIPPPAAEVAAAVFPPPAPTPKDVDYGPLSIIRVNPEKDKDVVQSVSVTFNQPMVPLTDLDALDRLDSPLTLSPSVKGRIRWLGTRTLSFVPDEPLPPATLFTATVAAGTTGISGEPMAAAHTWSFETRRPKVLNITPRRHERWALPDSTIAVQFNQPVDPASVVEHMRLRANGKRIAFTFERTKKGESGAPVVDSAEMADRRIELTPTKKLPLDSQITLVISAGVRGTLGSLTSREVFKHNFRTYGPLKVFGLRCYATPCSFRGDVNVHFSNPIPSEAKKHIKLTPPPTDDNAIRISGSYLYIYGGLKPDTRYKLRFDGAMTDIFGQRLGKAVEQTFSTGDYAPAMALENRITTLESAGPRELTAQLVNVPSAGLTAVPIKPHQLSVAWQWVQRANQRSWDIQWRPVLPAWAKSAPTLPMSIGGRLNQTLDKAVPLSKVTAGGTGLFLVSLQADVDNPRWYPYKLHAESLVQVTDLGLQAWYDYDQMLVWLTRLSDTGLVGGANVSIFGQAGGSVWTGKTDSKGVVITPGLNSLGGAPPYFIVAEHEGDMAFIRAGAETMPGGQWLYHYNNRENAPTPKRLTGHLFSERGIYRPGEVAQLKGLLRLVDRRGIHALPDSVAKVEIEVIDSRGTKVHTTTADITDHDTFNFAFQSSPKGSLGGYTVRATPVGLSGVRPAELQGSFRVDAYRAPEFRVSSDIDKAHHLPGQTLKGHFEGAYLFGAPMRGANSNWYLRSTSMSFSPKGHRGYVFGGRLDWSTHHGQTTIASGSAKLDAEGKATFEAPLETEHAPDPRLLTLAVEVIDANRQSVASTATSMLHPAAAYFGVKTERFVYKKGEPIGIELIAVEPEGKMVPGLSGALTLERQEWKRVTKQVKGRLVTNYETDWPVEDRCAFTTAQKAASCTLTPPKGGYYRLHASGKDAAGRRMTTARYLWIAGPDFKRRDDDLKLNLVLDRDLYSVGDKARLLISSPFKKGRALLTISRLGLIEHKDLGEIGPSKLLDVPVSEATLPNVRLGVVVIKKREGAFPKSARDDKNRPMVISGAIDLRVDTKDKKIGVAITPARKEIRPGEKTAVEIRTTAPDGSPVSAEVMVAAVDEGVLSLIGYQTPDPLSVIWQLRGAELAGQDLRTWLTRGVARVQLRDARHRPPVKGNRKDANHDGLKSKSAKAEAGAPAQAIAADAPKEARQQGPAKKKPKRKKADKAEDPADEDGEEKEEEEEGGEARVRSRFATTAHYMATVKTDDKGYARVELDMPDNLTTFRVMAVANDTRDLFGSGQDQITISQPLLLRAALPRFANIGDRFMAGVVLNNETGQAGEVTMEIATEGRSGVKLREGSATLKARVATGAAREFAFPVEVPASGDAVFTFKASLKTDSGEVYKDAVQGRIEVQRPVTTESVAVYGTTTDAIRQDLSPPEGAFPDIGGLEVTLSSTMLTNLHDAIEYLVEYPYGCLEQTASRVLPLVVLRELVVRYNIAGLDDSKLVEMTESGIARILSMQRYNGGFAFWPQGRHTYVWPSIYALFVLSQARAHDHDIPQQAMDNANNYVGRALRDKIDPNTGHPLSNVTLAFAAAVLAESAPDKIDIARDLTPIFNDRKNIPLFSRAFLVLAYEAKTRQGGDKQPLQTLMGDLSNNAVEEASDAHFAEPKADSFVQFFHSDNRTDAIALMAYMAVAPDDPLVTKVARGLMEARVRGRWGNTQENAYALLSLSRYAGHYEKERPDFIARLWYGDRLMVEEAFEGRDTRPASSSVPMQELQTDGDGALVLAKEGPGRLYYRLGMTYAPARTDLPAREQGFSIERRYEAVTPGDLKGDGQSVTAKAGAYVRVHLTFVVPTERHWVVVDDPLPAGVEPVNLNFKTSLATLDEHTNTKRQSYWGFYWRAGFDHTEQRDDRVLLFADRLAPGVYEHSYVVRTTTPGDYYLPPSKISEMYQPEVFGRTSSGRFGVE